MVVTRYQSTTATCREQQYLMCDMLKGHMGHIRAKPVQTPQAPSHLPRRKVLSLWGLLQRTAKCWQPVSKMPIKSRPSTSCVAHAGRL
ncbi:TPA: hypothetical protein ACH3X1_001388 [Trebouxia sp. C0004]